MRQIKPANRVGRPVTVVGPDRAVEVDAAKVIILTIGSPPFEREIAANLGKHPEICQLCQKRPQPGWQIRRDHRQSFMELRFRQGRRADRTA